MQRQATTSNNIIQVVVKVNIEKHRSFLKDVENIREIYLADLAHGSSNQHLTHVYARISHRRQLYSELVDHLKNIFMFC